MATTRHRRTLNSLAILVLLLSAAGLPGCRQNRQQALLDQPDVAAYLEVVTPRKIHLERFLTRPRDFTADGDADGVEAVLVVQDRFGDPVKCLGRFHFELYTMRLASGDKLGERVAFWPVVVDSDQALARYWDKITRKFIFPLQLSQGTLQPGRYILSAELQTPMGRKLYDEYEFSYRSAARP